LIALIEKVLIIKLRNIGDVLLTTPMYSSIRAAYPKATICALVRRGTEQVLTGNPDLDKVFILPGRSDYPSVFSYFTAMVRFLKAVRAQKFTLAINTTEGEGGILVSWASLIPNRWGLIRREHRGTWRSSLLTRRFAVGPRYRHMVLRNLDLLAPLKIPQVRRVVIAHSEDDKRYVDGLLEARGIKHSDSLIQCHPVSRWTFKSPSTGFFIESIQWLVSLGYRVVLTGADGDRDSRIATTISNLTDAVDLTGRLTLNQLSYLSKRSKLYFGVDSAPMHIAAATDTPVFALFGPTGAYAWGPWENDQGDNTSPYLARNGVQRAGRHTVIQQNWSCVPCGRDGCGGSKISDCLESLRIETLKHPLLLALSVNESK
jgi:heptosyltransferase-3